MEFIACDCKAALQVAVRFHRHSHSNALLFATAHTFHDRYRIMCCGRTRRHLQLPFPREDFLACRIDGLVCVTCDFVALHVRSTIRRIKKPADLLAKQLWPLPPSADDRRFVKRAVWPVSSTTTLPQSRSTAPLFKSRGEKSLEVRTQALLNTPGSDSANCNFRGLFPRGRVG